MLRRTLFPLAESLFVVALICAGSSLRADEPVEVDPDGQDGPRVEFDIPANPPSSKFALGLHCRPVDPALRKHLKLADKEGVVVEHVVEESPAAKAGFERYDVLVAVGGKSLQSVEDLVRAVDTSEGKSLDFALLRAGEKKSVSVTPIPRGELKFDAGPGEGAGRGWIDRVPLGPNGDEIRRWMERFENAPGGGLHLRGLGPDVLIEHGESAEMPAGLSISVQKQGNEPAQIKVERKRGDAVEKWEVTEETLDQLPADVQPHVRQFLGRGPVRFDMRRFQMPAPGPRAGDDRLERRMNELERRLDGLREELRGPRDEKGEHRRHRDRDSDQNDEKDEPKRDDV